MRGQEWPFVALYFIIWLFSLYQYILQYDGFMIRLACADISANIEMGNMVCQTK